MINAALQNKINTFHIQCLRIILNISRDDHVRNEYIYKQTNTKPLMQRVTKTQLSFLGTSIRRNNYTSPRRSATSGEKRRDKYDQEKQVRPHKEKQVRPHPLSLCTSNRRRRKGQQKTTYQQHIAKMIHGNASVEEEAVRERPRVEELHGAKL